jgi:cytochrome d ubiquinol oxidase subunit I
VVGEGLDARAEITDFWAMVFNPSSVERLVHVWLGAFLAGAFLVLSVHAYYLLRNRHVELSKKAFKIALIVATIVSLGQLVAGHASADGVAENQPAKLAALEGHFEANAPADMYLMGWVDKESQQVTGIPIPGGLSFLLHFDFSEPVTGLNAFPIEDQPPALNAIFQFYHFMVAFGMLMIGLTLYASFQWWRGKLFKQRWLLWVFVFAVLLPNLANQFGWFAAEMGRQPWVVYGLLRTSDALSASVQANQVLFSLIMFFLVYALLFALFIYMLNKKIKNGPSEDQLQDHRSRHEEMAEAAGKF